MERRVEWLLVLAIAAVLAAVAYRAGHARGVEAGWWQCAADLDAVS